MNVFPYFDFQFPKTLKRINSTSRCFIFEKSETGIFDCLSYLSKKLNYARIHRFFKVINYSVFFRPLSRKSDTLVKKIQQVDETNIATFAAVIREF